MLLTPLPSGVAPEALLDTPKQNLFVVECSTPTLDAISVGNIEHAAMVLGCRPVHDLIPNPCLTLTQAGGV